MRGVSNSPLAVQKPASDTSPKRDPEHSDTEVRAGCSFRGGVQAGAVAWLMMLDPAAAAGAKPLPPLQGIVKRLAEAGNEVFLPVDAPHGNPYTLQHVIDVTKGALAAEGGMPVSVGLEGVYKPHRFAEAEKVRAEMAAQDKRPFIMTMATRLLPHPQVKPEAMEPLIRKVARVVNDPRASFHLLNWNDASRPQPVTAMLDRPGLKILNVGSAHAWGDEEVMFPFISADLPSLREQLSSANSPDLKSAAIYPDAVKGDIYNILDRARGGAVLTMHSAFFTEKVNGMSFGYDMFLPPDKQAGGVRGAFIQYYVSERKEHVFLEFPYDGKTNMTMLVPVKYLDELQRLQATYPKMNLICEGIPGCLADRAKHGEL